MNYSSGDNIRKTWFLLIGFFIFIIGIGYLAAFYFENDSILYMAVIFSVGMSFFSYWFSGSLVLKMSKAKEIKEGEKPELYRVVRNLCGAANVSIPKLYLIQEQQPNAFATGRDQKHAVVAVTQGLLERLSPTELEGVIGHELSHIKNKDMLLQTMVVTLVGFVSILSRMFIWGNLFGGRRNNQGGGPLAVITLVIAILAPITATLIHLAISRRREFLADASSAELTHRPADLASALEKISAHAFPMKTAQPATAHLYISNPFMGQSMFKLFMTHPPIADRVKALRAMQI